MAQNLIALTAENTDVHESKLYMLWNGILNHHFPMAHGYGVALETSGTKLEFIVVKVARDEESVVLVVELKKPAEDTAAGRQRAVRELAEYIRERFAEEPNFGTIYGIASIGLSWAAYKMNVSAPSDPKLVFDTDWNSNITAASSFQQMSQLADMIDQLTGIERN